MNSAMLNKSSERARQPDGLLEGSRGLRSAATTPPVSEEMDTTLKGSQSRTGLVRGFLHPFRVRDFVGRFPGVSLRSTPGYHLASLRDARKFGSDDGKWIFESIFAALKNKTVAQAA